MPEFRQRSVLLRHTPDIGFGLTVAATNGRPAITSIAPDAPVAKLDNVKLGDVVIAVNRRADFTLESLLSLLQQTAPVILTLASPDEAQ